MFSRINCQTTIGLADPDIPPFSLFAGIGHCRAEIEGIKQDGHVKPIRDLSITNDISSQRGKLSERDIEFLGVLFLDVQPGAQGDGYTAIPEARLENRVPVTIFSRGMMVDLADCLHLFGSFDGLCIINDQQALFASLFIEPFEHRQGLLGYHGHLVKFTSPQEFAMVGSVCGVPQQFDKPVNRRLVADASSYNERAKIGIDVRRNPAFDRLEKSCCFSGDFTDSKHKASMPKSAARHNTYRHSRLFLFNHHCRQNCSYRSV
jgi:hypothetical protein